MLLISLLVFLLLLSVLVLIHEAGHYLAARYFGIKVEEFGFGFPPRALGKKIGETIYSINWLPIGGFVKLYGEDDAGGGRIEVKKKNEELTDTQRAFFSKPASQRAAVVVAGVIMNTILAALIFYTYFLITNFTAEVPLLKPYHFFGMQQNNSTQVVITQVVKNSPAGKAGVKPYDRVLSVDNLPIQNATVFADYVKSHKGKKISLQLRNIETDKSYAVSLIPRVNPPKNEGAMGVAFSSTEFATLTYATPLQKVFSGFIHPLNLMLYNFYLIADRIGVSYQQKSTAPISEAVSGPVGIYSIVDIIIRIPNIRERILEILNLAGIISISLAVFNVLPIPALDGGRLFFILIEWLTGHKIPANWEAKVNMVGMVVLLGLIVLITIKDIGQFFF